MNCNNNDCFVVDDYSENVIIRCCGWGTELDFYQLHILTNLSCLLEMLLIIKIEKCYHIVTGTMAVTSSVGGLTNTMGIMFSAPMNTSLL